MVASSGEATAEAVVEACAGAEASSQACAKASGEASGEATATVDGEPDREDEIVVYGLSKWQTGKSLKERLEGHLAVKGIRRCRKQPTDTHAFVHFLTASAAEEARKLIDGHVWKGSELWTKQARAMDPERFVKRQRLERDAGEPEPSLKNVVDCVTPLHALPYEEQLLVKRKVLLGALRELPTKWKMTMKEMPKEAWAAWRVPFVDPKVTQAHEGAPCELAPVIPAPRTHGYRNKCEFSFGRDAEGRPCIGFLRGALRFGPPVVGPPDACPNVSDEMKAVVQRVQAFLLAREVGGGGRVGGGDGAGGGDGGAGSSSEAGSGAASGCGGGLPPYDKVTRAGFWRQLLVRQAFNPCPTADGEASTGASAGEDANAGASATPAPLLLVVSVQQSAAPSVEAAEAEVQALLAVLLSPPLFPPVRPLVRLRRVVS